MTPLMWLKCGKTEMDMLTWKKCTESEKRSVKKTTLVGTKNIEVKLL